MEMIVITVSRPGELETYDIEVPTTLSVSEFVAIISNGLGWSNNSSTATADYEIVAHPPGRILKPTETLAQAQVWDGALLSFQTRDRTPSPVPNGGYTFQRVG